MIGTMNSVVTVAPNSPPITARPSGAFCSPPSPRLSAIGSMPSIMADAVIRTGRIRAYPADHIASAASRTARQIRLFFLQDLLDFAANASQIAAVDVGVHVEYRGDVVVIDDDRTVAALHVNQIRQELRGPAVHRARVAVGLRDAAP